MTNVLIVLFVLGIVPVTLMINYCIEHDDEIIYVIKKTIELQKERKTRRA